MKTSNPTGFSSNSQENHAAAVQRNEQLEKELTQNREDSRTSTEIHEAVNDGLQKANEGLKSAYEGLQKANEGLLSGNEELRRLNKELESAKKELRNRNEEITTINEELIERNKQLNNSKRYTEEIFNTIHDPLIVLDKEFRVLRATGGFYKMFKVNEEATEGSFLYDLGNKQWDIPVLRKQLENVLPQKGYFKSLEVDHVFNTIGRRIMKLTASQFENYTHEKLILLAVHDITDKRKVEEGLAEVERLLAESKERRYFAVDSAGIGTWDYNPLTGEMIWDSRCRALFGIAQEEHVNYSVFLSQIHPEDRAIADNDILETLEGKKSEKYDAAYRTIAVDDQSPRWLKSKGRAYFDEESKATRFIGTVQDFSVEKSFEEKTKEVLRRKDEFMSIASHELKTPITSLKAIVQILAKYVSQKEDFKVYNLAQKATKQIDKLSNLIKDLLDITRLQAGKLQLNNTSFSIIELINECLEEISDKIENYEIEVEGSENILVFADKNRIEQVLINLINNALKYAPDSKLIKLKAVKDGENVKITVSDFGIGIDEENIPFVFDRFFRVESSKSFTGLGLGLYISAEIVKRHQGEIGIDSERDKGSTFWFTVPGGEQK